MKTRAEELMEYLEVLNGLHNSGFFIADEINRCVKELERELRVQQWDKTKTYRIAAGTVITIDDKVQGINIEGPAELIVIPG